LARAAQAVTLMEKMAHLAAAAAAAPRIDRREKWQITAEIPFMAARVVLAIMKAHRLGRLVNPALAEMAVHPDRTGPRRAAGAA